MTNRRKLYFFILCLFLLSGVLLHAQSSNLSKFLTEKKWNELFPNRFNMSTYGDPSKKKKNADFYSFKAFLKAAESFPQFISGNDTILMKRELCAFLANVAKETSGGWDNAPGGYYKWGLYYTQELNCEKGCPQYTDTSKKKYPPVANQSYHGRGPLQISWNYNYGQFSEAFFNNKETLLNDPSLVVKDAVVCFASAIWFWTTTQYPKPSCHDIMANNWQPTQKDLAAGRVPGFGAVINVINGGLECGTKTSEDTRYRYNYYKLFCKYFGVDPGPNVECADQKPFGQ